MAEEIDPEKCNFRNFGSPVILTLTLDRVIRHRPYCCASFIHLYLGLHSEFIEIGKQLYGRTDVRTLDECQSEKVSKLIPYT